MPVLRTRDPLVAKPHAGTLCTVRFSLTKFSRDPCVITRASFPRCRRGAADWKVCRGGRIEIRARNRCRTGCVSESFGTRSIRQKKKGMEL